VVDPVALGAQGARDQTSDALVVLDQQQVSGGVDVS
jgi:hypothetical protein